MKVAILGAGPAGLYCAYLMKRSHPQAEVRVYEQNPPDATFGFGVVFSDRALEFLKEDDQETHDAIAAHLETWDDITLTHGGRDIRIDGVGFAAIGRLTLLKLLQERVRSVGVEPAFHTRLDDMSALEDADIIVAADGVNSLIRSTMAEKFGTRVDTLNNRFAWFGTSKPFDTLTQTFRETELGHFNAHHYRYQPNMSTFIIEVDEPTFHRAGFGDMSETDAKAVCEDVFAEALDGHSLISNKSVWRQFPKVHNEHWSSGKVVLVGDALRTAHFSIGSGTRLAMEDVIALVRAVGDHPDDVPAALASYEAVRRPIVEKLVRAANTSADWYENFPGHMVLEPIDFAMSYITRSGRIDADRLRRLAPGFAATYDRERGLSSMPQERGTE